MTNVFFDLESIPEQGEEEAKARIAETIAHPASMKKKDTIDDWHNGTCPQCSKMAFPDPI